MLVAAALSILTTITQYENQLQPFILAKTESVALKVRNDIEYALSIGVPFDKLRGVDKFVSDLTEVHPELSLIEVQPGPMPVGADGTAAEPDTFAASLLHGSNAVLAIVSGQTYGATQATAEIMYEGQAVGHVIAHTDPAYVVAQMQSVFFDSVVILMAVTLVAVEIVVVLTGFSITEPLRKVERAIRLRALGDLGLYENSARDTLPKRFIDGLNAMNDALADQVAALRQAGVRMVDHLAERYYLDRRVVPSEATIIDARIPLFVFCVAEELQKSFLPLFVAEYYQPTDFFEKSIMVGLPISCFMFVIAAITPFAGGLVDRFGNRRLFLVGLLPALAGYVGCYLARSADDIVIARSITALGYAIITISAQSYIAAILTKENRAKGMAIFVGVLMAATMCGTAIGGILADWLGYKQVFLVSIGLASLAGVLGFAMLSRDVGAATAAKKPAGAGSAIGTLMRNSRFVLIVLFCAIPAKIILTGFLYLFVPIYLASLEASQSEIGRIMMLYSLIIIPISPVASHFADRLNRNLAIVIGATIMSGIVLMGLYQSATVAAVLAVVAALGVVHAFIKAPLIVAAMEAAEQSPDITRTSALSLLRTSERIGSVAGPVLVAAMLVRLDYQTTAALLGLGISAIGLVMALISIFGSKAEVADA
ncbi:MFS transporter [Donghicola sp. B5-SW-15]|uniref:MFS transporter n=2 Tax=Donghicola mangrovi TaxID=2729614 RepID=A0A850Q8G2_9RHOB|nr:MFS transporter [Donghicola mangrovi]